MEDPQGNIVLLRHSLECLLRLIDFPIAAEETRVFITVGISQHHLMKCRRWREVPSFFTCDYNRVPLNLEVLAVKVELKQLVHDPGSTFEILNRFE